MVVSKARVGGLKYGAGHGGFRRRMEGHVLARLHGL